MVGNYGTHQSLADQHTFLKLFSLWVCTPFPSLPSSLEWPSAKIPANEVIWGKKGGGSGKDVIYLIKKIILNWWGRTHLFLPSSCLECGWWSQGHTCHEVTGQRSNTEKRKVPGTLRTLGWLCASTELLPAFCYAIKINSYLFKLVSI